MLTTNSAPVPVKVKLLVDTIVAGKQRAAGEIVELSQRDYRYLNGLDRVQLVETGKVK